MSEQGDGFTKHVLRVTSQRWLTDADVSRSIWSHFAVLFVPDGTPAMMSGQAYVYITSGKNTDEAPPTLASKDSRYIFPTAVVQSVRCVTLTLFQIPNAPIQFWAEGPQAPNRTEDAIIAYTVSSKNTYNSCRHRHRRMHDPLQCTRWLASIRLRSLDEKEEPTRERGVTGLAHTMDASLTRLALLCSSCVALFRRVFSLC